MLANNGRSREFTIKTFVFMDLETTGLFPDDCLNPLNSVLISTDDFMNFSSLLSSHIMSNNLRNAPKITEISLVAVSRKQLEGVIKRPKVSDDKEFDQLKYTVVRLPCNIHTCQVSTLSTNSSILLCC
uniref:Exonuclease domain-containing protein n=1 Tax=Syphacia muris TaxID=451379 RepID=A0A0N5AJB6_9BILA